MHLIEHSDIFGKKKKKEHNDITVAPSPVKKARGI